MKTLFKRLLAAACAVALVFSFYIPSTALTEKVIEVELDSTDTTTKSNFTKLVDALEEASSDTQLTVKIKTEGTYYIYNTTAIGLRLRSNTTLDLNGSTLIRAGSIGNMIQVCDYDGSRDTGGYDLAKNITIKNGTIDGNENTTSSVNLVNIGHSTNINFLNVNFKHSLNGHLVELTGCKDCLIDGCTFSGYLYDDEPGSHDEALQFDICAKVSAKSWNGVYADYDKGTADNTPCKNMTVTNCTFYDYPSAVGNHKAVDGAFNSGIVIKNNKFVNSSEGVGPAIWCYGFDDSTVANNTFTGNYTAAIVVSGGDVDITGNIIGSSSSPLTYRAIHFTYCNAYLQDETDVHADKVGSTGGSIVNNKIYVKGVGDVNPVTIYAGCKLSSVSNNTLVNTGASTSSDTAYGLLASGEGTTIGKVTNNKITVKKGIACRFANHSTVSSSFSNNTLKAKTYGLQLSSSAYVKNCLSNTITATSDSGIYITGEASIRNIKHNVFKKCKNFGIYETSSASTSKTVSVANDFSGTGKNAIFGNVDTDVPIVRYSGDTRFKTSLSVCEAIKTANGGQKFDDIIVANGWSFPDALGGSYLASKIGAPIIMVDTTQGGNDTTGALSYITENYTGNGNIYILGGEAVVSKTYESTLKKEFGSSKVVRLSGQDRFETNLKIIDAAGMDSGDELIVCGSSSFADALSASSLGKPIMLVDKDNCSLSKEQKAYIKLASKVYILGGVNAVPSKYESLIEKLGTTVVRIYGDDRYETSIAITKYFFDDPTYVVVAAGINFPDGLCGGALANVLGAPLVLMSNDNYYMVKKYASSKNIVALGGVNSISDTTLKNVKNVSVRYKTYQ